MKLTTGDLYPIVQKARQAEYERALEAEARVAELEAAIRRFLTVDERASNPARAILHNALAANP
jgi:hypothetical protein